MKEDVVALNFKSVHFEYSTTAVRQLQNAT